MREHVAHSGMEDFVRHAMPQQHQQFFAQQPIVYVASADAAQREIWASAVVGRPGFVSAPDGEHLVLSPLRLVHGGASAEAAHSPARTGRDAGKGVLL